MLLEVLIDVTFYVTEEERGHQEQYFGTIKLAFPARNHNTAQHQNPLN